MLGTVLTQVMVKVTSFLDLCLAWISVLMTPCRTIIAVGLDRVILIAQFTKSQLVALKWNIEHLVARFIIAARLTKVEIMIALHNLGVRGQQLVTTVRQILQRVYQALKQGR